MTLRWYLIAAMAAFIAIAVSVSLRIACKKPLDEDRSNCKYSKVHRLKL